MSKRTYEQLAEKHKHLELELQQLRDRDGWEIDASGQSGDVDMNTAEDCEEELAEFIGSEAGDSQTDDSDMFEEVTQAYAVEEPLGPELPAASANLANKALRTSMISGREKSR